MYSFLGFVFGTVDDGEERSKETRRKVQLQGMGNSARFCLFACNFSGYGGRVMITKGTHQELRRERSDVLLSQVTGQETDVYPNFI